MEKIYKESSNTSKHFPSPLFFSSPFTRQTSFVALRRYLRVSSGKLPLSDHSDLFTMAIKPSSRYNGEAFPPPLSRMRGHEAHVRDYDEHVIAFFKFKRRCFTCVVKGAPKTPLRIIVVLRCATEKVSPGAQFMLQCMLLFLINIHRVLPL